METLYKVTGYSRQSYWKAKRAMDARIELENKVLSHVRTWRVDHPKMGSRTLYHSMKEHGVDLPLGITRFEQLLSKKGLTVGSAKRFVPKTSDGLGNRSYPNLANGLILNDINQLVVGDITYFKIGATTYYLFTLKDVYSQRLIDLVPSQTLVADNALRALKQLKLLRGVENIKGCIHHSDNGSQYDSKKYKDTVLAYEMRISRSKTCVENGSSEQLNHIVKNMYLRHFGIADFKALKVACRKVVRLMNSERSVKQLGYISVDKFEQWIATLEPDCKPTKTLYDFENST